MSLEDPFAAGSEGAESGTEDEGTRLNTQANAGEFHNPLQRILNVPVNPFKKAFVSLEGQQSLALAQSVSQQSPTGSNNIPAKPQYDVNEFKRLLLTGDKSASRPNPASAPTVNFGQTHSGDSSSNTDASSVSRQSIFEPVATVHHESPRTSQEISDDERQRLFVASESKITRLKPSAPSHRHGKPMHPSVPQTVSFKDPTPSTHMLDEARPLSEDHFVPTSPESPDDKHKVLPSAPSPIASTGFDLTQHSARREPPAEPKESQTSSSQHKKPAPALPPSRRSRPISMSSINSGRSIPLSEESSSPSSRPSNAPAPPPPRRSKSFRGDSTVSTPTLASVAGATEQSMAKDQAASPSQKARPPVPSNQSPMMVALKGPSRTSPASVSPSMAPPPPPPPRRRGSSQSSNNYTPSRLSGTHNMPNTDRLRSDSGASSISQLPMTTIEMTSEQKPEQDDVMADLTALQREVDELRRKMK